MPRPKTLTPTEQRLLDHLMVWEGQLVPRRALELEVWPEGTQKGSLPFYIMRLRRKVGNRYWIETRHRLGYICRQRRIEDTCIEWSAL